MEEELDLFEELRELQPFENSGECVNAQQYLTFYFRLNQPRTRFIDGRIQCVAGCARGFYDLYYLTRARFSTVTLEQVATILLNLCEDYGNSRVIAYYSNEVEKIVFNTTASAQRAQSITLNRRTVTTHPSVSTYGIDSLSFLDLLSLAGKRKETIRTIE